MPLPQVHGMFAVSEDTPVKTISVRSGTLLCFTLAAQDNNGSQQQFHKYGASLFVKDEDLDKWKSRVEPGNVFLVQGGEWRMMEKEGYKFPIPSLSLNSFNFKLLKTAWWAEDKPDE